MTFPVDVPLTGCALWPPSFAPISVDDDGSLYGRSIVPATSTEAMSPLILSERNSKFRVLSSFTRCDVIRKFKAKKYTRIYLIPKLTVVFTRAHSPSLSFQGSSSSAKVTGREDFAQNTHGTPSSAARKTERATGRAVPMWPFDIHLGRNLGRAHFTPNSIPLEN